MDLHVHFLPPPIERAVWAVFDAAGPKIGRPWPIRYRAALESRVALLRDFGVRRFPTHPYAHKPGVATYLNDWSREFAATTPEVLRSATFGHCWSPVGPAPAYNFRRAAEGGTAVVLHEMSLGLLTAALTAGAWGVPFLPVPDRTGTGYVDEDWTLGRLDTASCAFGTSWVVRAEVPQLEITRYAVDLRSSTHGSGTFTRRFARYQPMPDNLAAKLKE